jgi:N4-gp56 family major capsid protein
MVDAYTSTTALSNVIQAAVDQYVRAELRHTPMLRGIADTRPVAVDKPGSSVALYIHSDLAVATTPLSETVDPDAVALPNPTSVTLTPLEYGNATIATVKARATSFADVDPYQRDAVMYNMRDSLDVLVRDKVSGGTNVRYANGKTATNTVTSQDTIASTDVRYIVAKLRGNAAAGKRGDLYGSWIHPDVSADLRSETGAGAWRDSHQYAAPGVFWPGEIGVYEGCFFVETARVKIDTTGGADGTDAGVGVDPVYHTIFAGKEALAEGVVIEPEVRIGTVPDKLNRFHPMGWYGFLGWTIFRQKALYRLESGSSLAANT